MASIAEELAALSPEQRKLLELALKDQGIEVDRLQITPRAAKSESYPVSFSQERLWFLAQLDPASSANHIPTPVALSGALDVPALRHAVAALVERHEALRTVFETRGGAPVQVVREGFRQVLPVIDLRALPAAAREANGRRLTGAVSSRPFDLAAGPLLRTVLVRAAADEHALLLVMHHIVSDGWSMGLFFRELWALYRAFSRGEPSPLPPLTLQYVDFALWQRGWLDQVVLGEQLAYWRERLAGAPPVLALPLDRPRPPLQTSRGAGVPFTLDAALSADLRRLARAEKTTPFVVLLAVAQALLARVSGQHDVVVGTPNAGRGREEVEPLIGFFINTLVLRTRLDGAPDLPAAVARARETVEGANGHADLPFAKLVAELVPERSLDHSPIFQVDFAYQTAPSRGLELEGLSARMLRAENPSAQFDLSISLTDRGEVITGAMVFNADLFDSTSIRRLARGYRRLLRAALDQPARPLETLPLLDGAERHQVVTEHNDTTAPALDRGRDDHSAFATLTALLEARMRATPDRVAVSFAGRCLSYAGLEGASAALAARLAAAGVGPESVVGVCAERSIELPVALVAVLRAGAAYLPVDPNYPRERQAFLLADAGARVLLTQSVLIERLPPVEIPILALDGEASTANADPPLAPSTGHGAGAAYVIFTSGSTGKPKGVVNSHRGMVNRLLWMQEAYPLDGSDRVAQKTPFTFDVSVWEFFWPLIAGAELVMARPEGHKDAAYLARLLTERRVTTTHFVPSMLSAFLEERSLATDAPCDALRRVLCSGEALPRESARRFFERFAAEGRAAPLLENLYGPTEAAIDVTRWPLIAGSLEEGLSLPIGRPIANLEIHLLDHHGEPAGLGVAAELLIAGAGLARGYHGRPGLTAERFVPYPLAGRPGERAYRTGDLARRRADGSVEFLGRLDHQVKVRGFRVELGEIEAALTGAPSVRDAAVVARPDATGLQRLVAYLVAEESSDAAEHTVAKGAPSTLDTATLRGWLGDRLPEHMVPGVYVVLPDLPLTASGKADRKALAALGAGSEAGRLSTGAAFVEPKGNVERALSALWRELLAVESVGRDDNFFDLGGHSLLLIHLRERLRDELGAELPVVDLFRYPTIGRLAARIHELEGGAAAEEGRERVVGQERARRRRRGGAESGTEIGIGAVAIVGLAGRWPQAPDVEALWRNLRDGVEAVTFFSDEELAAAGVPAEVLANPDYVKAQAGLDGPDQFDAGLFGFSAREAQLTDPQQRLFLESAWQALEHAGYAPESFDGAIGVYGGVGMNNYWLRLLRNPALLREVGLLTAMLGNNKDFLATRVSYKLDLKGPSFNVQTACSTSLVATHLACQALLAGECDLALAGGVNAGGPDPEGYWYKEGGILSPDGHCRAFDAAGAGVIAGSGVGVVVLRRLSEALADGDTIWAVIRGSAVNNDGSNKVGFTAPSVEGQARVIAEALAVAGVEPATIGYVETHGTATPLGDPIEVAALTEVFGLSSTKSCALGSIKTNIGHADAAAGISGLIKATLSLAHGEIPPSLNFEHPNPAIDFDHGPFYVATERATWPRRDGLPRRAGVSSFGLGGTNAHLVLEEAPARPPLAAGASGASETATARPCHLLTISAATPTALDAATDRLAELLATGGPSIADVAHTLQVGRRRLAFRRTLVCTAAEEAAKALASRDPRRLLEMTSGSDANVNGSGANGADASGRPVAFLLPGVGDHYPGMAAELYRTEPVFREAADQCAAILEPLLGMDLREPLFIAPTQGAAANGGSGANGGAGTNGDGVDLRAMLGRGGAAPDGAGTLRRTRVAQPAVFLIDYALARLWMAWGVVPEALLGYSLGEYVAACLAGVLSLEDALTLVAARAELIDALPEGAMLAIPLSAEEVAPLLGESLALAATNGPRVSVVAGPTAAIEELEGRLAARELASQRLETSHAFHSPMLRPAAAPLTARVAAMTLSPPRIPYLSNVTGSWITAEEATDPGYWARHLCGTVRFTEGLARLLDDPRRLLLEVGPGQALSTSARQHPAAGPGQVIVASLRDARDRRSDSAFLLEALGRLWLAGAEFDWHGFAHGRRHRRVPLPTYPFERQSYWLELPVPGSAGGPAPARRGGRVQEIAGWFHLPRWRPTAPSAHSAEALRERVAGRWLLITDELGLATRLAERLAELGAESDVVTLGPGDGEVDGNGAGAALRVDPADPGGWPALIDRLARAGRLPSKVVHLAGFLPLDAPPADARTVLPLQQRGLLAVVELARSLIAAGVTDPLRLAVVARGLHGVSESGRGRPELGSLVGALRVIPQEYRNFECLTLDLDLPSASPAALPARQLDGLLADLAGCPERNLAYRGGSRWELEYSPVALDPPAQAEPAFRRGGVYLITGGFGLVGRTLSTWLASEHGAKLSLLGRGELPPRESWDDWLATHGDAEPTGRRIAQVRALEALGAEVLPLAADVADRDAMARAVAAVGERFGRLHGVVHLAGATGQGQLFVPFDRTDRAACEKQLAAKAVGSYLLAEVLEGIELDFVVLFSSMSSVLGGLGFTAYSAANSFLDAFAAERHARGGTPWLAINWDGWREPGQAASAEALSMAPEEAVEALRRALTLAPLPGVVVSVGELDARLGRWVRLDQDRPEPKGDEGAAATYARPAHLQTPYVAPSNETEEIIARLWGRMVGIDQVGIHDNFFQLGGDSLLATQLASRMRGELKVDVPLRLFFSAPTVARMATELAAGGGIEELSEIEAVLREVQGLSLEDVARELGAELAEPAGGEESAE